jgi:hypothetical protein
LDTVLMELRQRQPRVEDKAFLAFVRMRPCCACGRAAPSQAAHIRMSCLARNKRGCGKGEKPDDRWCVALCAGCHLDNPQSVHRLGEEVFWRLHTVLDPFVVAIRFRAEYEAHGGVMVTEPAKKRVGPARRNKSPNKNRRSWPKQKLRSGRKIRTRRKR